MYVYLLTHSASYYVKVVSKLEYKSPTANQVILPILLSTQLKKVYKTTCRWCQQLNPVITYGWKFGGFWAYFFSWVGNNPRLIPLSNLCIHHISVYTPTHEQNLSSSTGEKSHGAWSLQLSICFLVVSIQVQFLICTLVLYSMCWIYINPQICSTPLPNCMAASNFHCWWCPAWDIHLTQTLNCMPPVTLWQEP